MHGAKRAASSLRGGEGGRKGGKGTDVNGLECQVHEERVGGGVCVDHSHGLVSEGDSGVLAFVLPRHLRAVALVAVRQRVPSEVIAPRIVCEVVLAPGVEPVE